MSSYDPFYDSLNRRYRRDEGPRAGQGRRAGDRFLTYLRNRPAESWIFFGAGFLLAALFT
jgi:hypothetical protein